LSLWDTGKGQCHKRQVLSVGVTPLGTRPVNQPSLATIGSTSRVNQPAVLEREPTAMT
jgi:hypothetical protein